MMTNPLCIAPPRLLLGVALLYWGAVTGHPLIGLFCAFLPIPMQMVVAAFLAVVSRCNLPISVMLVWITNPITIPPMFYFTYRLGAWLLNMELTTASIDLNFAWLWENLGTIGYPLMFGSLVCGWVAGITGFVITRVVWRWHAIRRWQERRARLHARRANSKRMDLADSDQAGSD